MQQAPGKSAYAARLDGMKQGFANAKKQSSILNGDDTFPEGVFVGKVTAKLGDSQSGSLMVKRTFFTLEGELAGLPAWDNIIIGHDNPMVQARGQRDLMRFLDMMGYTFDEKKPSTLEPILEELSEEAPVVRFQVKHTIGKAREGQPQRTFVNVTVLEKLEGKTEAGTNDDSSAPEGATDDTAVAIKDFCEAHGIEQDALTDTTFYVDELTLAERTLLKASGYDANILMRPAKKATAPAKGKSGKKR
jgi:hypothetical protein